MVKTANFMRVTQNLRVFAYIARDYESAAEVTSLLSSVASLAITFLNPKCSKRVRNYGKPNVAIFNLLNFIICILVLCVQLCV